MKGIFAILHYINLAVFVLFFIKEHNISYPSRGSISVSAIMLGLPATLKDSIKGAVLTLPSEVMAPWAGSFRCAIH